MLVGRVATCWRYPVKSMVGEQSQIMFVLGRRVDGDRVFGVFDSVGRVLTAGKSAPALLQYKARWAGDPLDHDSIVVVTLPNGTKMTSDDPRLIERLSIDIGQPVSLRRVGDGEVCQKISGKVMPVGTLADQSPVHLMTTASLSYLRSLSVGSAFEDERFRYNFLIRTEPSLEGFVEDGWLGGTIRVGSVLLAIETRTGRCLVPTRAQKGLAEDLGVLKTVREVNQNCLGVRASVVKPGLVRVNDEVELL